MPGVRFDRPASDAIWRARSAAVSLRYVAGFPRFGLLGGTFEPNLNGVFSVILPGPSPLDDVPHEEAPDCRVGLPHTFHQAVISGLCGREGEGLACPSGRLTLEVAGHDVVGSAALVFLHVARSLHNIFALPTISEEVLTSRDIYLLETLLPPQAPDVPTPSSRSEPH